MHTITEKSLLLALQWHSECILILLPHNVAANRPLCKADGMMVRTKIQQACRAAAWEEDSSLSSLLKRKSGRPPFPNGRWSIEVSIPLRNRVDCGSSAGHQLYAPKVVSGRHLGRHCPVPVLRASNHAKRMRKTSAVQSTVEQSKTIQTVST